MDKPVKKKGASLFDLVTISQQLKEELISNEGELAGDLEERLVRNSEQLETKATAYAYTIDSIDKDIQLLKDMEKQIRDRKKKLEAAKTRIKTALLTGLNMLEVKTIESGAYRITVGKKRDSVFYHSEELIPEEYFEEETKVIRKLDKAAVLTALKAGVVIPGVELVQDLNGNNQLYIK